MPKYRAAFDANKNETSRDQKNSKTTILQTETKPDQHSQCSFDDSRLHSNWTPRFQHTEVLIVVIYYSNMQEIVCFIISKQTTQTKQTKQTENESVWFLGEERTKTWHYLCNWSLEEVDHQPSHSKLLCDPLVEWWGSTPFQDYSNTLFLFNSSWNTQQNNQLSLLCQLSWSFCVCDGIAHITSKRKSE